MLVRAYRRATAISVQRASITVDLEEDGTESSAWLPGVHRTGAAATRRRLI